MTISRLAPAIEALIETDFPSHTHPYRILERAIEANIEPHYAVLEIGCGRSAPILRKLKGKGKRLIGIDLVPFVTEDQDLTLLNDDVCDMKAIEDNSVDVAYSRSVMEHVRDTQRAYSEIARVLKHGGKYIFLTPNLWDYASLIAWIVPNRWHGNIVRITEGRPPEDTFPVFYRSNTYRSVAKLAKNSNFIIERFEYLGQYPCYLVFNKYLFELGCAYEKFLERRPRLHVLLPWILCVLSKPA